MKNRMISFLYDYIERGMIMKTVRHFALALLVLCLALLIASCGCSRVSEPAADSTTASRPAATDPSATTAPEAKLSSEAAVVSCGDFALDVKTLSLTVPNATESYSLADEIAVSDKATWTVSDAQGQTVYENKTVPLNPGDNAFLLHVTAENNTTTTKYTVTIRRRPLYTLTFNTDGGTPIDPLTVEEGSIAEVPNPTRTGYTFVEWNYNLDYPVEKNLKVKASWTPDTDTAYTVEYYLENAAGTGYDKILTEPKTGTTDAPVTAEQKVYAHFTYSPAKSSPNGTVAPDGSLVLKMYYLRDAYTVTFNGNGGMLTEGTATQSVRYGAAAAIPTFARSGYDFAGWDSTAGCDAVEQPLTITAQWTIVNYPITYTMNGGTNDENNPTTYTVEDEVDLADPSRVGYTFAGWTDNGAIAAGSTGAKSFTANWTPISHAIAYNLNGGTNAQANPATYTVEDAVTLADPTRLGYTFNGWTEGDTIALGSTGAKTFTANWTIINYAITYNLNGGTNAQANPATYTVEDEIELADPSRVGYTFAGWTEGDAIELGSTGEKTFTANWTPINYAITYNLNGGTNDENNPATYTIEDEVTLADPTRLGYTFNGWTEGDTIELGSTGAKTFTANWTIIHYAITYNLNGGTNAQANPATYTVEDEIALADPSRVGYTFNGWSNGGVIAAGSTGEKTFTANWTAINYQITYNLNGGTNAQANPATYTIEDEVTLADPSRVGYTFNGWTEGNTIELGSTGAKTFTANWTIINYAITYNLNGGTNAQANPATYTVEDEIELADPSRVGYTFAGWTEGDAIELGSTGAKSFTASWTPINYAITYNLNGGTNAQANPATYTIEDEVELADPSRLGYTFNGWTEGDTIELGSTGAKTFTATWTIIHYPINYNLGGAENDENNPATYTVEDEITLAALSKVGYTFNGWSNGGVIAAGSTGEMTFTANWTAINYAITYNLNGGTNSVNNPATYTIEDEVALADPSRLGYTFTGWTDDGTIARGSTGAKSFTASWTINTYTVSYNLNGGSLVGSNPTTYTIVDNAPLISPTRNCYRFLGWYTANGTRISNLQGNAANLSLTARWECYVTLDGSGAITGVTDYCRQNISTLNVPSNLGGTTVRSVTSDAFNDYTRLTTVSLPSTVTSIGQGAFKGCSGLVNMTIPFVGGTAGKTAEDTYQYPFGYIFGTTSYTGGTKTQQYYYGSSTSSDTYTYYYIPASLRSVTVTGGEILYGAFYNCSALTSITLPNGATGIGSYAFYNFGPAAVTIPNSVTTIGKNAFKSSGVTSVIVGTGVESVGVNAFAYCSGLTSITWNAVNCADCASSSVDYVFRSCSNVTSISVGSGVTSIPAYAFAGCSGLSSVAIGNSVASIGNSAFNGCSGNFSLVIPNSVATIGNSAFKSSGVTSVTVGTGVESVGVNAFAYCSGLTSITWNAVNCADCASSSVDYVFRSCSNVTSISVGNSVETLPAYAFVGCTELTSVSLGNHVTNIGNYAFYNCSGAFSLVIPNSVETIGSYAFSGCSGITEVVIPDSVTTLGSYAFGSCYSLVSVSIGNGVTTVSSDAFWYCTGLVSVSLGNNVETIKSYAFAYCSSLSSITIPASVTAIEYSAFQDCSALSTAYFACPDGWHESGLSGTKDLSDPTQNASTLRTFLHLLYRD